MGIKKDRNLISFGSTKGEWGSLLNESLRRRDATICTAVDPSLSICHSVWPLRAIKSCIPLFYSSWH